MILFSAHTLLAGIAKTPEFALDKEEAKQLAISLESVSRHYDVAATEKTLAWTNLLMTAGMIYGSRFIAVSNRKRAEKRERRKEADDQSSFTYGQGFVQ